MTHVSEKLEGRFAVYEIERHGRSLYVFELDRDGQEAKRWLLAGEPPIHPGMLRIAIERPDADPRYAIDAWDSGSCLLQTHDESIHVDFQGRRLFGPFQLRHRREGHWFWSAASHQEDPEPAFALSAGGIVLRPGESLPDVCLVRPRRRRYWSLPKGTVETDESLRDAAIREVEEETGVRGEIALELDPIEYWFWGRDDGQRRRIHKSVAYYLMHAAEVGEPTATEEIERVEWFPAAEAVEKLAHGSEQQVLAQGLLAWERAAATS